MKKRTCKPGYTKFQQRMAAFLLTQTGVVPGAESPAERAARRLKRNRQYEAKRRLFAKLSGRGARECARRARAA